jgi:glycosyltransferase involved in cell wall biosynthesis
MKVLICFEEPIHYGLAASSRVNCYARAIISSGAKAEIIMPFSFLAKPEIEFEKSGLYSGVPFLYIKHLPFHPRKKYALPIAALILLTNKWLGYLGYLLYFLVNRRRYDAVLIYKFSTVYTLLIQLVNIGKPVVSELCEIPCHGKRGVAKSIHRFIKEQTIFKLFDGFIVISENLCNYIKLHKAEKSKILKVPILYGDFTPTSKTLISAKLEKYEEIDYILHSGSLSESKDGIIGILKAFACARQILDREIKLVITGFVEYASNKNTILKIIDEAGINEAVHFVGFLNKEELAFLQSYSKLAVINKYQNEQNYFCFPTKLAEYLSNAVPVICTSVGEVTRYLKHNENAYVINPGDKDALCAEICNAFTNEPQRKILARNGQQLAAQNFHFSVHSQSLNLYFKSVLQSKNAGKSI